MTHPIHDALQNLVEGEVPGFRQQAGYPTEFQALDFPTLAGEGKVFMSGNNQAFFFVDNPKGNSDPAKLTLNTERLERLMHNIKAKGTAFTLAVDADMLENPERFVEKYQSLRPEADEQTRRALLQAEIRLIGQFLTSKGMVELAQRVAGDDATQFLQNNFTLVGLRSEEPLKQATWEVEGANGQKLIASQAYSQGTENIQRGWKLGESNHVSFLRENHGGADALASEVEANHRLPMVNLTLGRSLQQRSNEIER